MQLVDIKSLNYQHRMVEVDFEDKKALWQLGLWNEGVNNSFKTEPDLKTIKKAAHILESYYGRITKYSLWPCSVCGFRIVFGN